MSIPNSTLVDYLRDQNATLAAEIKRLEAVAAHDAKLHDATLTLANSLADKVEKQAERIALLESAIGLPEGCDVFQLERAMKEGAIMDDGTELAFQEERNFYCFENKKIGLRFWVNGAGVEPSFPHRRLYCRKEAKK